MISQPMQLKALLSILFSNSTSILKMSEGSQLNRKGI